MPPLRSFRRCVAAAALVCCLARCAGAESVPIEATLAQAEELDRQGSDAAVDRYFEAAVESTRLLERATPGSPPAVQFEELQREALYGVIDAGQRYGRLDPRQHLLVHAGGPQTVPIRHYGFAWRAVDFSRLSPAPEHHSRDIAVRFANGGLGAPVVVERISAAPNETFFRPWQPFAATAVLRAGAPDAFVLELYNPLAFDQVPWADDRQVVLAGDATAPLAMIVNDAPRQYLRAFTAPTDVAVQPQLVMMEPYQPGKIPVVFIHGLYSDPITWADMLNELRAQRDLYGRYQFWLFRYPTGGNVLGSAAAFRQQLYQARATFDPQGADPSFDQIVLVGHSLGGLVSKMQITNSGDLLWQAAAVQPFDAVRAPPALRARLEQDFFYQPVPMVKRVIFIGTPHRGSGMARRLAGRVGTALVSFGAQEEEVYRTLMEQNQDVFRPEIQRRRPTSIQLLDPDSPFLMSLEQMPINCRVRMHSVVGERSDKPLSEPGDGVVPVTSAVHQGDSLRFVDDEHEHLHRNEATIEEVARILRLHACQAAAAP